MDPQQQIIDAAAKKVAEMLQDGHGVEAHSLAQIAITVGLLLVAQNWKPILRKLSGKNGDASLYGAVDAIKVGVTELHTKVDATSEQLHAMAQTQARHDERIITLERETKELRRHNFGPPIGTPERRMASGEN